jgi:hypothetical protein
MNESLYIGEDHDFFYRTKKKYKDIKVFFSKNVIVKHEDRKIYNYFLQRFCYGLNIFSHNAALSKKIFMIIPFLFLILFFLFFYNNIYLNFFIHSLFYIFFLILISVIKYIKISKPADIILTIISIYISNLFYALGTVAFLLGMRKFLEKKIYKNINHQI